MKVFNEWETLEKIEEGWSIGRFADGELKYMCGKSHAYNSKNEQVRKELVNILSSTHKSFLSCIPTIFENDLSHLASGRTSFKVLKNKFGAQIKEWLCANSYGSAFISRMDVIPELKCDEYFERWKGITRGKRVIGISGKHFSLKEYGDLFNIDKELKVSSKDAWEDVGVLDEVRECDIVILSCGFAATIFAHRLAGKVQAIDVGKLGRGYLDGSLSGYKENKRGGFPW